MTLASFLKEDCASPIQCASWRLTLGLVFYRGLRLYPYRIGARNYADLVSDWYFLRRFRYGCLLSLTAEVFFTWFSPRAIFHVVSQHPPPHFYNSVCWILMTFLSAVTSIALVA
jgi:hypothetical protein